MLNPSSVAARWQLSLLALVPFQSSVVSSEGEYVRGSTPVVAFVPREPAPQGPAAAPVERPVASALEASPGLPIDLGQGRAQRTRPDFDVDRDGALWARGADYKARAGADGFEFTPFLGSDAPRNMPVRFRLREVLVGGESLGVPADALVRQDGDTFVLEQGPVEVRYDVALVGVELSFRLATPAGTGDVVFEVELESELAATAVGAGLAFRNERGGVDIGAAVVLAEDGRRLPVSVAWDGQVLRYVVARETLAECGPVLVVDPLISTFAIDTFDEDLVSPDAAYNRTMIEYAVVYSEVFSASDLDVYMVYVDPFTQVRRAPAYVNLTSENWYRPRIAAQQQDQSYLVVATAFAGAHRQVVGRTRDAVSAAFGPSRVLLPYTASYDCADPDVGGDAFPGVSYFCVAYNRDYPADLDVWVAVFDANGVKLGNEVPIANSMFRSEGRPAISKSTGNPNGGVGARFVVAWAMEVLNTGQHAVEAALVNWNGALSVPKFEVLPRQTTRQYRDVQVSCLSLVQAASGGDYVYLVVADDQQVGPDAYVSVCAGGSVLSTTELQVAEHVDQSADVENVVIATHARHFTLAYMETPSSVRVTDLQVVGDRLGIFERRLSVPTTLPQFGSLSAASMFSGGDLAGRGCLFPFSRLEGTNFDLWATTYEHPSLSTVAGSQECYGVPNSTGERGYIQAFGDRLVSSTQLVRATGLPSQSFGFFLAGMTAGYTPAAGGGVGTLCLAGAVGRFGVFNTGATGSREVLVNPAVIPTPTGFAAASSGQTWRFQVWHRDAVAGVPTSNFTNAVAVRFL